MTLKAVIRYSDSKREIGWTAVHPFFADQEKNKMEALGFRTTVELMEIEETDTDTLDD